MCERVFAVSEKAVEREEANSGNAYDGDTTSGDVLRNAADQSKLPLLMHNFFPFPFRHLKCPCSCPR